MGYIGTLARLIEMATQMIVTQVDTDRQWTHASMHSAFSLTRVGILENVCGRPDEPGTSPIPQCSGRGSKGWSVYGAVGAPCLYACCVVMYGVLPLGPFPTVDSP